MSSCNPPPYILQQLPDITEYINYPVKNVQRIKYTCFDVSKCIIAFGATSGGIYIFNRTPCEFVQLIPNKDGPITRLAISSNEKHIAFANGRGIITVTACDQSLSGGHTTVTSKEHQGNEVTTMVWSGNNLFTGDDIGKIAVMQLQSFITMFQSSTQTIMNLDSRICQLDVKDCMLLVSTLTRTYICDTLQEQYRQIGQKLRDGEFGACFVTQEKSLENGSTEPIKDFTEAKKYNIVDDDEKFAVGKGLENVLIYCARPSSRLWEASIEGTVRRTHQFKQVLAKKPMKLLTVESYNNEEYNVDLNLTKENEGQSVNFPKIFNLNGMIFSFKRDVLYFLDTHDEINTVWFDSYKDIADAKLYQDNLYLWLTNGTLVSLKFMKIDKFLMKCYVEEKYKLCGELCALFCDYLKHNSLPAQMHIIVGLRDKIKDDELLKNIEKVLQKFASLKANDVNKTGIYVLDNAFKAQSSLDDDIEKNTHVEGNKFGTLPPEAFKLQTLKDLSVSVSDKFSTSKKILKEKWDDFEDKMKLLNTEKQPDKVIPQRITYNESINDIAPIEIYDTDIIYKESSQQAIEIDNNNLEEDRVCKSLYQYFRLSLVSKDAEKSNLISIIENYSCDISKIYQLMLLLEKYCLSVGALEESKFVPNNIFLSYISSARQKNDILKLIIKDEDLYKYFVDSCISVNTKSQKFTNLGCECGFPLPFNRINQIPEFSKLIDEFIEKQWLSQTRDQCYEICKKMPYLWRKMLYLRRNEDLLNLLQILLQMLDEKLLNSFLPQFTLDTWDRAIQLYATLHANKCLNCNRKFEHISVKETLSWDDIGAMIIKSIGGKNAIKVMEKHAKLINPGEVTMKFYHTCLIVSMYEKIDGTIRNQMTDAIYSCFEFEDSREQICRLLRSNSQGNVNNTSLPIIVAAKTLHWGLTPITDEIILHTEEEPDKIVKQVRNITINQIIDNIADITNGVTDCLLCGLPLENKVMFKDGGLWVFKCGDTFHGPCLDVNKVKLCPTCTPKTE
ncbi:hypothetical protein O0L34_g9433 [Tuta absoluta]|nr:hypothetical protein O0L34_g9433 [Tuta absoluta]